MSIPSGNVDFAPTFLHMLGIAVPSTMQGRPLVEAFRALGCLRCEGTQMATRRERGRFLFPDGAFLDRSIGRAEIAISTTRRSPAPRVESAGRAKALRYRPWKCGRAKALRYRHGHVVIASVAQDLSPAQSSIPVARTLVPSR